MQAGHVEFYFLVCSEKTSPIIDTLWESNLASWVGLVYQNENINPQTTHTLPSFMLQFSSICPLKPNFEDSFAGSNLGLLVGVTPFVLVQPFFLYVQVGSSLPISY